MEVTNPPHVPDGSTVLQVLSENIYSNPAATISELLEIYLGFNQAKAFSSLFDNSGTNRSSFAESVAISSRDGTILLLAYTKVVVQFHAKFELLRRTSQKGMAV